MVWGNVIWIEPDGAAHRATESRKGEELREPLQPAAGQSSATGGLAKMTPHYRAAMTAMRLAVDVRFGKLCGLRSEVAPCPLSARSG